MDKPFCSSQKKKRKQNTYEWRESSKKHLFDRIIRVLLENIAISIYPHKGVNDAHVRWLVLFGPWIPYDVIKNGISRCTINGIRISPFPFVDGLL